MDYVALYSEVIDDPNGLGLTFVKADEELSALLNDPLINSDVGDNTELSARDIIKATDITDINSLTSNQLAAYQILMSSQPIDLSDYNIINFFKSLFGAETNTRASLIAMVVKPISRAEKLFAQSVSARDVHIARRTI